MKTFDTLNTWVFLPAIWFCIGWTWKGIIERKRQGEIMRTYSSILAANSPMGDANSGTDEDT